MGMENLLNYYFIIEKTICNFVLLACSLAGDFCTTALV